ncbi:MAG: PfkB family carbohydrate kinase [bacterium]|nr:PfkB family carbohydrate kinase [bacterium]
MVETLILNLNPALDRTAIVERYNPYGINKAKKLIVLPGGKGANLGRALKNLEYRNFVCSGILGGTIGKVMKELLDREGIMNDYFWIKDETRIAYATYEESSGIGMITNEQGPEVTREEIDKFINFIKGKYLKSIKRIILSGGAPPSIPIEEIRYLLSVFKEGGKEVFIDTSGEILKQCTSIGPFCIKINEEELKDAFNVDVEDIKVLKEFYSYLSKLGTTWFFVTRGEKGAMLITKDRLIVGKSKRIYSHYAIGSGDAFLGGIIYGRISNLDLTEILKLGIACGTANTLEFGACIFKRDDVEKIKEEITVEELLF